MGDTGGVAVFGSINLDRTQRCDRATLERLAAELDVFPAAGETLTVESPPVGFEPSFTRLGGKGANQAVAAARAGSQASIHGAVGPDADSFGVREQFESAGVTPALATRETPTGAAYIWVTPDGENRILVTPGANGTLTPADAASHAAAIARNEVVLLQNEIPTAATLALLDELPDSGPTVVFDPAPTAGAEQVVTHPAVDLLTPNETEFAALRSALQTATDDDARVVRTEDGAGASLLGPDLTPAETVAPPAVDVVDTTGAGDAFAGYLGAELAAGSALPAAIRVAVRAGAYSCTADGAMTAPNRERL